MRGWGLLVASLVAVACGAPPGASSTAPPAAPPPLREVILPDLTRMDPPVQQQARDRFAIVGQKRAAGAPNDELGAAYGDYGMLLHAGEYFDAAEPAYLNARDLMPRDPRWPYYLGHLKKNVGDVAGAIAAFHLALELQPSDVPTLVWLGRAYLDQGRPAEAGPLFERARTAQPASVAVLMGLGQVALASRDYAKAVEHLNAALQADGAVASIHSPLALAYRGLGQTALAEEHIKQWRNTEVPVQDPLKLALDATLESGLSYELRGVNALEARDFPRAVSLFKEGVALTSGKTVLGRSLRHKLGTALFLSGDLQGAFARFEEVAQLAPGDGLDEPTAKANYSLGVVHSLNGNLDEGLRRLTAAVRYSPNYLEARLMLGQALRASGRFERSLAEYNEAVRLAPRNPDARFGYALALVQLRRYAEARSWLEEAVRVLPEHPELAHALARILAAAPDDRARDGARALTLVQSVERAMGKTLDVGETLAMALAEVGRFDEALGVQRGVLEAAERAGQAASVRRMRANERLYERRMPCRMPWPADHPVHAINPAQTAQTVPSAK
jgi:tetratricopeptide (TPR) repeat protein